MKGVDDGLELEPKSVEPGPGLLTPEEQKKQMRCNIENNNHFH